jgi:hypothetical protein
MTDDDIRDMLRTRAQEATVSDDAWTKISARLGEPEPRTVVRQLPRRLAVAGVAAAAIAGTVVIANLPGTSTHVASTTTTTVTPASAGTTGIEPAVTAWLASRVQAGGDWGTPNVSVHDDGTATVTFTGGRLATELLLRRQDGSWSVVSASSDLLLLDDPTYDGHELVASAVAEVDGTLDVTYVVDGQIVDGGSRRVTRTEQNGIGHPIEGAHGVTVRLVLKTNEGIAAVVEQPAQVRRDPAAVTGSHVAVWPSVDAEGLASLQQDADGGRRPDLLDPQAVAGGFLGELLPRGETSTTFAVGAFRQGDAESGEVPYTLAGGADGTVLVRRGGGAGSIWYVVGATSASLDVLQVRHEAGTVVADVQSSMDGDLTWTGATSIAVKSGQKVSIGHPGAATDGSYPIVLRLVDGTNTVAIAARLG